MAIRVGGIEIVVNANVTQATQAFSTLGRQNKKLQNNLKQTKTLFGGLGGQLKNATGALAGLSSAFAAFKFANIIKDATLLAARVKNLGTVLNNVGRIAGFNSAQIRNVENSVKKLGITTRSARQSLTQLAQANIDLSKAAKLTRIAQDAAVIAGIDSSEAFNRLVVSIQRNDVRLLRNLGIVINLNSVYQRFAQTTGRTAASLTAVEKRQLVLNEVIAKGALITGTYEASLNDSFKQLTSLRRVVEEATRVFGEQFEPVLEKVVKTSGTFLKNFAEGRALIGPRFVAVVGAAVVAIGALAAAVGVLAAAFAAASIAGGPLTIALVALAALLGLGVAAWVNYQLEVTEAEQRLVKVAEEAENTAQAIADSADEIDRIKDLAGRPLGISLSESEELLEITKELARQFPKLRDELLALGDAGDAAGVLELFDEKYPEALLTSEDAIESFNKKRIEAEKRFRFELQQTFRAQERGLTENSKQEQALVDARLAKVDRGEFAGFGGRLSSELIARKKLNVALQDGTAEAIKNNAVLIKNSEALRKSADEVIRFESAIRQLQEARLTATFQEFQAGLASLEQGANQAIQIISKLENDRIRLFKGTNIGIIDDFAKAQAQLISVDIQSKAQLQQAADAFSAAQLADLKNINLAKEKELARALKKEEITREEFEARNLKRQRSFDAQQRRIDTQARALVEDGIQQQNTILEARVQALANVTRQLEEQERATAELIQLQELEASGVAPKLIALRKKFNIATRGSAEAQRELADRMMGLNQQLRELGAGGLAARFGNLSQIPEEFKKNLSGPIVNLINELLTLNRAFDANRNELVAKERSFNAQFVNAVKERSKQLIDEEEKLNQRLRELGDDRLAKIDTLGEAQSAVDSLDQSGKAVDDLIRELDIGFRDKVTPGVAAFNSEFDRFAEGLKKATSSEQLSRLQELFPSFVGARIEDAEKALDKLIKKQDEFQKKSKPAQQRDDRIARQKRFNELVDRGVAPFRARQEVQRIELEQRKELEKKEKEIADAVKKQQETFAAINAERTTLETQFNVLLQTQTAELEKQAVIRQKLVDLKAAEVASTQAELNRNKESQAQLARSSGRGLDGRGRPTNLSPEAAPPAPDGTPQAASAQATKAIQRLSKEAVALKKALTGQSTAVAEGAETTRSALSAIRDATDANNEELTNIFDLIDRDSEAGAAAFKQLRLRFKRK